MLDLDPSDDVIEVDEDLPQFSECIKYSEADILLAEYEHLKKHYSIEILEPDFV